MHNFDITLLCSKQTINILKADGDSYTLGYTYRSFASSNSKLSNAVAQIKNTYATKTSVNEKITQSRSEITVESDRILTVVETTYATRDALATGLNAVSSEISQMSDSILLTVRGTYATSDELDKYKEDINAELSLAVKTDEYGNLLSAIHAEANQITIKSDYFELSADGHVTASGITITGGDIKIPLTRWTDSYATVNSSGIGCSSIDAGGAEVLIRDRAIYFGTTEYGVDKIKFNDTDLAGMLNGIWYGTPTVSGADITGDCSLITMADLIALGLVKS